MKGYSWRDDGAGWQLRRSVIEEGKRRKVYIAHLSRTAYARLKRAKDPARAFAEWVRDHDKG